MRAALLLPVLVCGARALSFCDPDDAWTAEWADEFEGGALDESKWSVITGANLGACRSAVCDAEDVYLEDGALVLRSRRSDGGGANFTTGAVWTLGKAAWSHAPAFRLCVAAALPGGGGGGRGQGVWPAHWLMPEDASCDPDEGEPDVLEMVSGDGLAVTTYHWQTTYPAANCSYPDGHLEVTASTPMPDDWGSAYHEYAVERARDRVAYVIDGVTVLNASADAADPNAPLFWPTPFHLILNTAIGGAWPGEPDAGTVFPTYHPIDYVRVARAVTPASE